MRTRGFRWASCVLPVFAILAAFGSAGCNRPKQPVPIVVGERVAKDSSGNLLKAKTLPASNVKDKQEKVPLAESLPDDVVQAWKAADAGVCWVRTGQFFWDGKVPQVEPGDIPAFYFLMLTDGVLSKLPSPTVPFGLDIERTQITNLSLKDMVGLTNLRSLNLRATAVTDAGLKELAVLNNLQWLDLSETQVTDVGLKELAGLKNLESLDLRDTKVTDEGLKQLSGLRVLQSLTLGSTQVTAAGLAELFALMSIGSLDILGPQVTSSGLRDLTGFKVLLGSRACSPCPFTAHS